MVSLTKLMCMSVFCATLASAHAVSAQTGRTWIKITDQAVRGNTITVDDVSVPSDGWIAVHLADENGNYQEKHILGHVTLKAGVHPAVSVPLSAAVATGRRLFVALHEDKGIKGRFEFDPVNGYADEPFVVSGVPVVANFQVR